MRELRRPDFNSCTGVLGFVGKRWLHERVLMKRRASFVGVLAGVVVGFVFGTATLISPGTASAHEPHPADIVKRGNCEIAFRLPAVNFYSGYYTVAGKVYVRSGCRDNRVTVAMARYIPGRGWSSATHGFAYGGPKAGTAIFGQAESYFCDGASTRYASAVQIEDGDWHRDDGSRTPIC